MRQDVTANRVPEQRRHEHRNGGRYVRGFIGAPSRLQSGDVRRQSRGGTIRPFAHHDRRFGPFLELTERLADDRPPLTHVRQDRGAPCSDFGLRVTRHIR